MKRRNNVKLHQLMLIVIIWSLMAVVISVYDHLVLLTENTMGPSPGYSFSFILLMNIVRAIVGALIGGSFLVFYINVKYQDKPYAYTIIAVSISFILIIFLISILIGFLKSFFNISETTFIRSVFEPTRMKNMVIWSIIVGLTQLFLQLNSKFGYGIFWNLLRGKYNTPKEEHRIFMFLDLNSSTTIAERLGDEKYHAFLKDFYADITNPVLDNKGEIYQYVGDEVVIAWKYPEGVYDSKCINCFFQLKDHLNKVRKHYAEKYGLFPEFKAGIHIGRVIVGEIGIIKRDITYSGNVLNTTSRMVSKCKEFGVEIITSQELLKVLKINQKYKVKNLGAIELRGKEEKVYLAALSVI